jgi:hypothetical protein
VRASPPTCWRWSEGTAIRAVSAPADTPLPHLIVAVGVLTVLLAAERHRPTAIAAALDAIARLLGR